MLCFRFSSFSWMQLNECRVREVIRKKITSAKKALCFMIQFQYNVQTIFLPLFSE